MAQEFVVLNCCSCNRYQVQQSKKATKWLCKVCNHKQSVKQFFGRGSAKQVCLSIPSIHLSIIICLLVSRNRSVIKFSQY